MKYLVISKGRYYSDGYQVREFATKEELAAYLLETDALSNDVIVAQRLGVTIQLGEWVAPVEPAAEEPEEEEKLEARPEAVEAA